MERKHNTCNLTAIVRVSCLAGMALVLMGGAPSYAQVWHFGLGTGFSFMNIEGDQGFNIINVGPVQYGVDLNPDQINDVLESAFGLAGYATDATWMVQYSFGHFVLGGESQTALPPEVGGGTLDYDLAFEVTNAKMTLGRTVYRSQTTKFRFTPYLGLRYLKHDISADFVVTQASIPNYIFRGRDWSWTDALIGVGIGYRIIPKLNWSAVGDAGFGGSNGTYYFTTSLTYSPTRHLSLGPNFSYTAIDYENGKKGDADWYIYKADQFGVGLVLAVNFNP